MPINNFFIEVFLFIINMPNDTRDCKYDLYNYMEQYGRLLVYNVNETKCLIKKQPETYKTTLCLLCNVKQSLNIINKLNSLRPSDAYMRR